MGGKKRVQQILRTAGARIANNYQLDRILRPAGAKRILLKVDACLGGDQYPDQVEMEVGGQTVLYDTTHPISREWFFPYQMDEFHDGSLPSVFYDRLGKEDTVFDIGCHIGQYTVIGGLKSNAVHAFDMDGRNLDILRQNLRLNDVNNCVVNHAAVGAVSGTATFYKLPVTAFQQPCPDRARCLFSRMIGQRQDVTQKSVDEYVVKNNVAPDALRINVNGAEGRVLLGALKTLETGRPEILVTLHRRQIRNISGMSGSALLSWLRRRGYKIRQIDQRTGNSHRITPSSTQGLRPQILAIPQSK